jgi:hypothetical protein
MADSFVPTPKEFFAGFGIGDEIKETNKFLQRLIVQFVKMIRLFYKTLKNFIFKDFLKLWPLYVSLLVLGIVVSFFTDNRKRNIFFVAYVALLLITFIIFVVAILLFEVLIRIIVNLIIEIKRMVKNFMRKNYIKAIGNSVWCFVLCIIIFAISVALFGVCYIIRYFNSITSSIFDSIEKLENYFNSF